LQSAVLTLQLSRQKTVVIRQQPPMFRINVVDAEKQFSATHDGKSPDAHKGIGAPGQFPP
jgi:hypothetical protein